MLKKKQITLTNIVAYIEGNLRYKLWYSKHFKWLIRKHIQEQIEMRILYMKKECYFNGTCTECGCVTIALQMANKPCDGACYPEMMNNRDWNRFVAEGTYLTHMGYMDSVGVKWIYRKDYLQRYNFKTLQNDILLPTDKTMKNVG